MFVIIRVSSLTEWHTKQHFVWSGPYLSFKSFPHLFVLLPVLRLHCPPVPSLHLRPPACSCCGTCCVLPLEPSVPRHSHVVGSHHASPRWKARFSFHWHWTTLLPVATCFCTLSISFNSQSEIYLLVDCFVVSPLATPPEPASGVSRENPLLGQF